MSSSQSRREAIPAVASTFCKRSALNASSFCENNTCEAHAGDADQRNACSLQRRRGSNRQAATTAPTTWTPDVRQFAKFSFCHQQWRGAATIGLWCRTIQALCDCAASRLVLFKWYYKVIPPAQIGRMCYCGSTNNATPANDGATRSGMQVVYHNIPLDAIGISKMRRTFA